MLIDDALTLKKLGIFMAFMRTGNLNRAAAELHTSSVSVHRAIHSLEIVLRCALFRRQGRNLQPMESAHVLFERSERLISHLNETIEMTRETAGVYSNRFRLGALYSLTIETVPKLIMGLKVRRSALDIDLILGSNVDLMHKLKRMELDAMLVSLNSSVTDPDCEHIPLFADDIFLATPSDAPFHHHAAVDIRLLQAADFITLKPGYATHQDSSRIFELAGFSPNVALQVNDIFTLMSMVSSGVGYALLPGRVATVYENHVKLITLHPRYRLKQQIGLVFMKNRQRDPNVLALLAECRMYAARHGATKRQT